MLVDSTIARLLGPAGIPKLRKRAAGLKLKGKGHEVRIPQPDPFSLRLLTCCLRGFQFSDASRLLSFYQLWLDDLFPKARFLDALAMVEKAGHKKGLISARSEWINEGRKAGNNDDDDELDIGAVTIAEDSQISDGGIPAERTQKTPERDDVPDDDDIYDVTPRAPARSTNAPRLAPSNDAPDDDDLEALMAEAESMDSRQGPAATTATTTTKQSNASSTHHSLEEDDLDALIAEAEEQDRPSEQPTERKAGNDSSKDKGHEFADDEEAMQEMDGLW